MMSEGSARYLELAGSFGLGAACALLLVLLAAEPAATDPAASASPATDIPAAPSGGSMASSRQAAAGSMDAATATLAARLALGQGSDADWDLLAQSYEFLGRSADAELARQHKVPANRDLSSAVAASAGILGLRPVTANGAARSDDVDTLLAKAEEQRRNRDFKGACVTFAMIAERGAMTADLWADYADAEAATTGSLAGGPARSIEAALARDPKHAKALWLKASLAHEQHRYGDAVDTWKSLLAIVPAGSSDARIVETNLAEATRLARG